MTETAQDQVRALLVLARVSGYDQHLPLGVGWIEDRLDSIAREHAAKPKCPAAPAVERDWEDVPQHRLVSGTRSFLVEPGYPCKIEGERGTWRVIRFERRKSDHDVVNVEVKSDGQGHSRTFPVARLRYMRPRRDA